MTLKLEQASPWIKCIGLNEWMNEWMYNTRAGFANDNIVKFDEYSKNWLKIIDVDKVL